MLAALGAGAAWNAYTLQKQLHEQGYQAKLHFQQGLASLFAQDPVSAQAAFKEAERAFRRGGDEAFSSSFLAAELEHLPFVSKKVAAARHLFSAGAYAAQGAQHLARAMALWGDALPHNVEAPPADLFEKSDRIRFVQAQLQEAAMQFDEMRAHLNRIDPAALPDAYRGQFELLQNALARTQASLGSFGELARALSFVFGFHEPRFYLVVLQNASELRPAGGFAGNVLELEVAAGQITRMQVRDVYDIDGQIVEHTVPPKALQDISTAWSLHDANWFRNFPESAETIAGFYEEVEGKRPDGVIAVSSPVLEGLLEILGPQTLASGQVLQARSVLDTINRLGITQRPGETLQARMLSELSDVMVRAMKDMEPEQKPKFLELLSGAFAAHDVMAWFSDPSAQKAAQLFGVSGSLATAVIEEEHILETEIGAHGEVVHSLTIIRRHTAPKRLTDPLYGKVNKDYVRLYVPLGSELIFAAGNTAVAYAPPEDYAAAGFKINDAVAKSEASVSLHDSSGIEVFEESGFSVFAAWSFVSPGETVRLVFQWKPPQDALQYNDSGSATWTMKIVKQPGFVPRFTARLRVLGRAAVLEHPETFPVATPLTRDMVLSALLR